MPLSAQHMQIQPCRSIIKVLTNPNNQNTAQPHSVNLLVPILQNGQILKTIRCQQQTN